MSDTVKCRASARFDSQYGPVRPGEIFWSEPSYAEEMRKKGNVTIVRDDPKPSRNQAFDQAPETKQGKEPAAATTSALPPIAPSTDEAAIAGSARPASASRPAPRSRRRT